MYIYVQPPQPIVLHLETVQSQLALTWTGGIEPFQVQAAAELTKPLWTDVGGAVTNQSLALSLTNWAVFYRVQGR
jgi:hypothetical protein